MSNIKHIEIIDPYGFIYITTNMVNGKKYLGQRKFHRNWQEYLGSGTALKNAIKKYGKENFTRNIVCWCYSAEELNKVEYEISVFLNVVESDDWYNLMYGGNVREGCVVTQETREKLSKALKGKPAPNKGVPMSEEAKRKQREAQSGEKSYWYGKHHTEETKEKLRTARTGTKASEETRKKMSNQRQNSTSYFYGHSHSEESKHKMSEAKKGEKSIKARRVIQLTKDKQFIKEWPYIQKVTEELGIIATNISRCCRGKQKTVGGFCWMYAEEYYSNKN